MKHGITFMKISTFYCKICNEDLQVKLSTEELQGFRLVKMWNYSWWCLLQKMKHIVKN